MEEGKYEKGSCCLARTQGVDKLLDDSQRSNSTRRELQRLPLLTNWLSTCFSLNPPFWIENTVKQPVNCNVNSIRVDSRWILRLHTPFSLVHVCACVRLMCAGAEVQRKTATLVSAEGRVRRDPVGNKQTTVVSGVYSKSHRFTLRQSILSMSPELITHERSVFKVINDKCALTSALLEKSNHNTENHKTLTNYWSECNYLNEKCNEAIFHDSHFGKVIMIKQSRHVKTTVNGEFDYWSRVGSLCRIFIQTVSLLLF